ncbi:MAG: ABC transporter substrate-binding protein [Clostridia bacterium]|nr:ABC transporter substrate-binding protein [Clostridia bacterium]
MKLFTRLLALALVAAFALAFVACGNKEDKTDDGKYVVGINQLMIHDALDAATQGFKDALIAELGEENVEFLFQDAANSPDTCATIASTFVTKEVDLILANATPALQATANATTTIPILGTSITEYGVALDIDNFTGLVGGNVSGTSDLAPLAEQAQMIIDLVPGVQTVGIIYSSTEANSAYQVKVVKEYLETKNITVNEYPFSDSNDIAAITQNAASACDALYVPTDNAAASAAQTIYGAMAGNLKPVIAGEEATCKGCGIATLTISYYDLGVATGKMAAKILKGEAKIEEMPIEYAATFTKKYNKDICDELGIDTDALEAQGYVAIVTE